MLRVHVSSLLEWIWHARPRFGLVMPVRASRSTGNILQARPLEGLGYELEFPIAAIRRDSQQVRVVRACGAGRYWMPSTTGAVRQVRVRRHAPPVCHAPPFGR